jgi:magnesium transporter
MRPRPADIEEPGLIVVHYPASDPTHPSGLVRKRLDPGEEIPTGSIWIDMVEPTVEEDKKVQHYVGAAIPTRADPDYAEPPESHYAENGVRYLQASVISEPEDTPDVTDVTFVVAPAALVTVRYHACESFDIFGQKLSKAAGPSLSPDAIAVGLVNTTINRSARALSRAGVSLDQIASRVFRAKENKENRSQIYSDTLWDLGREDEKISNLRESLVSIERLLLFLAADANGDMAKPDKAQKAVRAATKTALRDLQSLEEDASFKAQKVQFLLDATLGLINLAQNDIIKLFSVLAVIFMPPTVIASIYGMNFKVMPELEWSFGYPMAILLMICAAVLPYAVFRWKKWL